MEDLTLLEKADTPSSSYTLPKKFEPEKKVAWPKVAWRVLYPSIIIPLLLAPIFFKCIASDSTIAECIEAGWFYGLMLTKVQLFFFLLWGVPFFALACIKPNNIVWKWWLTIPLGALLGALSMLILGYFIKQENLLIFAPQILPFGIFYGIISGLLTTIRRPRKIDGSWK